MQPYPVDLYSAESAEPTYIPSGGEIVSKPLVGYIGFFEQKVHTYFLVGFANVSRLGSRLYIEDIPTVILHAHTYRVTPCGYTKTRTQ